MTGADISAIRDLVGIGIGPFNLGLACLSEPLELDAVFLDERSSFSWHPGIMLTDSTIQVPFLADLVSMADPTSRHSFLNWLKQTGRLYPFYIRESFHALRVEYDAYCRWTTDRLETLRWGRKVLAVHYDAEEDCYVVHAQLEDGSVEKHRGRHVVLGIGSTPHIPEALANLGRQVIHSADFLSLKNEIDQANSVAIVGSGQSAAEIYRELLNSKDVRRSQIDWITRAPRFFPMEYTKLTLEMTSPEYTDYFHSLPGFVRDRLSRDHRNLYKGISAELIDDIYDTLYRLSAAGDVATTLLTNAEVIGAETDDASDRLRLYLRNAETGEHFEHSAEVVIAATGYRPRIPTFLEPIRDDLQWDEHGRLAVARDYSVDSGRGRIFVQNGEEHTHGLTAPDLGFGAWRNSVILASLLGEAPYPVERKIAFQQFGAPAADGTHWSEGEVPQS